MSTIYNAIIAFADWAWGIPMLIWLVGGGIVLTIADEFDMPVKYVGLGEGIEDLKEFDPEDFAKGIFE